ncbi:MAG: hypothetical protein ACLU5E_10420 [Anaerovoracaceae bacterium]
MKRYLHPRWGGIDKLETYIDGIYQYFHQTGNDRIQARGFQARRNQTWQNQLLKDR